MLKKEECRKEWQGIIQDYEWKEKLERDLMAKVAMLVLAIALFFVFFFSMASLGEILVEGLTLFDVFLYVSAFLLGLFISVALIVESISLTSSVYGSWRWNQDRINGFLRWHKDLASKSYPLSVEFMKVIHTMPKISSSKLKEAFRMVPLGEIEGKRSLEYMKEFIRIQKIYFSVEREIVSAEDLALNKSDLVKLEKEVELAVKAGEEGAKNYSEQLEKLKSKDPTFKILEENETYMNQLLSSLEYIP